MQHHKTKVWDWTLFVLPTSALQHHKTKVWDWTLFVLPTSALQHHKTQVWDRNFVCLANICTATSSQRDKYETELCCSPNHDKTVQRRLSQPFNEMTKSLHSLYSICYDNSSVDPCRWLVKCKVWLDFLAAFQVKKTSAKSNTRFCHAWLHEAHYGITFLDLWVGWQHAPAYWKIEKYNSTWKSKTIEEDSRVLNFARFFKLIWNTLGFYLMQPMQVRVLVIRC